MRKGALLIISAPVRRRAKPPSAASLLARRKDLRYSISCTTRAPRPGEKDGKHYFFLTRDEFKRKISRGEFLEWAMVHDEYYGTPRHFVDDEIKARQQRDHGHRRPGRDVDPAQASRRRSWCSSCRRLSTR